MTTPPDTTTSQGLLAAAQAVLDQPRRWDSPLGAQVATSLTRAVPHRWTRPWPALDDVTHEVLTTVLTSTHAMTAWARAHPHQDLWGWVITRALRALADQAAADRLCGLTGDRTATRLADRLGPGAVTRTTHPLTPQGHDPVPPRPWGGPVTPHDLGPVLTSLVNLLTATGLHPAVATTGTCRLLELAVAGEKDRRHTRARADARDDGTLARLGVTPDAAGAWMSALTGSRRLGPGSAITLALRDGHPLTPAQEAWLVEILLGTPTSTRADTACGAVPYDQA
ncbi:hypothetical protein [Actinomyces wuliandei]|uniref:hypothetical protein n=1 Tax=Actinomyces wuliandei TaxID=2057743 RepID=UPI001119AC5D|nr:hypothetical protein [Actinomyces wuliandei]